jgi:Porin subfamily
MVWERHAGILPAAGVLLSSSFAFLMAGMAVAHADELADLRANQQLLQQRIDQLAAAAPGAAVPGTPSLAGSFPRSFLIPGTDTSIHIGGFIRFNAVEVVHGGQPTNGINGEPNTTIGENGILLSIPLAKAPDATNQRNAHRDSNNFEFNVRESRLRIETRTPTPWGAAGTVFEFDWAGGSVGKLHVPDSLAPRLRLAYATLGPWLAGQGYSLFNDLESHPTTLDFGGDVGPTGLVRPPQLRYTWKGANGWAIAGALEAPDTTLLTPNYATDRSGTGTLGGVNLAVNSYPSGVLAVMWHQPWGHVSARGVVTGDQVRDGRFIDRWYEGYGGALSGSFKTWGRDVLTWGGSGGVGMQRYQNGSETWDLASNIRALPATQAEANADIFKQTSSWGAHAGYEHWWGPHLRSNFSGGIQHKDFPRSLIGHVNNDGWSCGTVQNCYESNKDLISSHVNLVYSPVSFVDVGVEWVHGHRETTAGFGGDLDVVIGQMTMKF